MCPQGYSQTVEDSKSLLKQVAEGKETFEVEICKKNVPTPLGQSRIYRGTLKGGLLLDNLEGDKTPYKPPVGFVDDLSDDVLVNIEKMKLEHQEKPEHFGIHLSKLKALENDRVQDKGREIIADIF